MGYIRTFSLSATLVLATLTSILAAPVASLANPPAHAVLPQHATHVHVVRAAPLRVVRHRLAQGVPAHRKIEIVKRTPVVHVEHDAVRVVTIERHEPSIRHDVVVVKANTVTNVVLENFNDDHASKHPHFSAALTALVAAHEDLQRTVVPGDISAISALKTAKAELDAASASAKYRAHRSSAMELTGHAIHDLEGTGNGNPDELAQQAIQDVKYCIYMADHPGAE